MPLSETTVQIQLISNARKRAAELVRAFADACLPRETVKATCERAATTLDRYCTDLLASMLADLPLAAPADVAWLRSQYLTLIVEVGASIRDTIQDSERRHAAAQGIQCRVLEHERHLRPAVDAAVLAHAADVEIVPPKPAESALPAAAIPSETV
jgi:hypothetical protein